ncbi:DUF6415 family natural product biosynthesis protein [Streptomyces sp. NPDC002067]
MTPRKIVSELPVDVETINDTIQRARQLGATRPDLTTLADLEELLLGHIALLLPEVQAVTAPQEGGAEGTTYARRLTAIRAQLRRDLGTGRLSAHVRVATLAQDCQWLLDHHEETP